MILAVTDSILSKLCLIWFSILRWLAVVVCTKEGCVYRERDGLFYGDLVTIERVQLPFKIASFVRITSTLEDSVEYLWGVYSYFDIYNKANLHTIDSMINQFHKSGVVEYLKTKGTIAYPEQSYNGISRINQEKKSVSLYYDIIEYSPHNLNVAILAMRPEALPKPMLVIVGIPTYFLHLYATKSNPISGKQLNLYKQYINNINKQLLTK